VRSLEVTLLGLCWAVLACEEPPKKEPPKKEPAVEEAPVVAPKLDAAPVLEIDTISPKVGTERALLVYPEGKAKLAELLSGAKRWLEGKDVTIVVARQTKVAWVTTFLDELGKVGPSSITIRTDTRKDFSAEQRFVPEARVKAPPCSVVAMVTSDYGTAVWKLSGGVASKRSKGMAGPDLSMTGDTIERIAKGCKESTTLFIQVAEGAEWGLAFDLGASSRTLEHAKFDTTVLLGEIPTPGHKVDLKR
jgi:hypothetical protein